MKTTTFAKSTLKIRLQEAIRSFVSILKVHCNLSEPDVTGTGIFSRCDQIS